MYADWKNVVDESHDIGRMLDAASAKFLELTSPGKGQTAIDLACGDGTLTAQAAAIIGSRGGAVLGVDACPEMIAAARRNYGTQPGLRFEVGDVTQELVPAESCDAAFCRFSLPFLTDPAAALWFAFQALKPGGRMCVMSIADADQNELISVLEGLGSPVIGHVLASGRKEVVGHQLEALGFHNVLTKRIRAQVTVADPAAYWRCIRGLFGFPEVQMPPSVAQHVVPGIRLRIAIVFAVGRKPVPGAQTVHEVQSADDALALARKKTREISATSIAQTFKGEPVIFLDVRSPTARINKIKDSLHVTRDELEQRLPSLIPDPEATIVVYCDNGNQSAFATGQLRALGYTNVYSLQRGLAGWEYVGMKVVPA